MLRMPSPLPCATLCAGRWRRPSSNATLQVPVGCIEACILLVKKPPHRETAYANDVALWLWRAGGWGALADEHLPLGWDRAACVWEAALAVTTEAATGGGGPEAAAGGGWGAQEWANL
jgi:hypothetical protein